MKANIGGMLCVQRSKLQFRTRHGISLTCPPANEPFHSNGYSESNATPKAISKSTKQRIIVKGYSQVTGLDFNETFAVNETFALVVRIESVRIIFALAAANDLFILHIDCKNAFLQGQSDVDIYVYQPEGFVDIQFPQKVLHLNKSLYGLKQALRIWYLFLCGVIIDLGFVALESHTCIYIRGQLIVAVYVDDIKVVGNQKDCEAFYHELVKHVKVENKGPTKSFLSIDIIWDWDQHLITINQRPTSIIF
jgi:hypothetical protein